MQSFNPSESTLAMLSKLTQIREDISRAKQLRKKYFWEHMTVGFVSSYMFAALLVLTALWFAPDMLFYFRSLVGDPLSEDTRETMATFTRGLMILACCVYTFGAPWILELMIHPGFAEKYPEANKLLGLRIN